MCQNGNQINVYNVINVSYVCPHAFYSSILVVDRRKVKAAPEGFTAVAPKGLKGTNGLKFRIQEYDT